MLSHLRRLAVPDLAGPVVATTSGPTTVTTGRPRRRSGARPGRGTTGLGPERSTAIEPSDDDRRLTLERFVERAGAAATQRRTRVLDVGPIGGRHAPAFDADRYRSAVLPADDAVSGGGSDPTRISCRTLPVDDERYGVVLCVGVLDRAGAPRVVMAELTRALEPDGVLFLAAPLIVPLPTGGPVTRCDRFGLNYLLATAGLELEDLRALEHSPCYGLVARKARKAGPPTWTTPTTPS